jgi:hypothetical protein
MVQLSAARRSCIAILLVSQVSFTAITLCVASQRVFIVVSVYFVIDSVRKLFDTPSYTPGAVTLKYNGKKSLSFRNRTSVNCSLWHYDRST